MPIQFLNGTEEALLGSTILDLMTGKDLLNGLGSPESDIDKGMYDYLVKTRNVIAVRPDLVSNQKHQDALKMYDYAIKYWNTHQRDKALDVLELEENKMVGMGAIVYSEQIEGLSGFWGSVKKAVKKTGKAVAKGAKAAVNAVLRFNPISITARAGFQLALRMNFNKMSEKLIVGYMTPQQAQANSIAPAQHQKTIDALNNVKKLYVNVLKGKESKLKKAIEIGSKKKWSKAFIEDEKGANAIIEENKAQAVDMEDAVNGLGEAIMATATAAAAPFVIKAWSYVKGLFTNEERQQHIKDAMATGMTKKEAKESYRAVKKAEDDLKKKEEAETKAKANAKDKTQTSSNAQSDQGKSVIELENQNISPQKTEKMNNPNPSVMDNLLKPKNLLIAGGVFTAGFLLYKYVISPKQKSSSSNVQSSGSALNGVRRKKRAKALPKKSSAKRSTAPRRRKSSVKSLKLK